MPMELPFESPTSTSFTSLVRRHSGDMAPRAMLDELIRVGAVEQTAFRRFQGLVRASTSLRDFHPDALEQLWGGRTRLRQHVRVQHGQGARTGRFERIVFADDGLREELMPAFDALLRAKGHQFLLELHNWIIAQESSPAESQQGKATNQDRRRRVSLHLGRIAATARR